MQMSKREYERYVREKMPKSPLWKDMLCAFAVGGAICCVGEVLRRSFAALGASETDAGTWTSVALVFLGAFLTGLGVYDKLAKHGGAGTLVPITGFSNAVVSPAMEFRTEGFVTGTAVKMFTIAGPVIVYGVLASALYGVVLMLTGHG